MLLLKQAWLLARSDLRQELRNFEMIATALFFTATVWVMFVLAFSGVDKASQPKAVPGLMWVCAAFVGTLTLSRVFEREREADTLRALLAAPVERFAIFLAKLTTTMTVLMVCMALLVPGLVFAFPGAAPFAESWGATIAIVVTGCFGYACVGTLFAAGLATSNGKNMLLSVILYPLTMPVLLYALVTTQRLLQGHPEATATITHMAALDIILFTVAAFLFESVLVGVSGGSSRPVPRTTKETR